MALVITEPTPEVLTTTNANSYAMAAFTPTANSLLVLFVATLNNTAIVHAVSGGSLTWKLVLHAFDTLTNAANSIWIAQVGASPASTTITCATPTENSAGSCLQVFEVTGHNSTYPVAQYKIRNNSSTAAVTSVTMPQNMNTNNGYMAAIMINRNPPNSLPPTGWTEVADGGFGTPVVGWTAAYRVNGETGNVITFTSASGQLDGYGIEINEASEITQMRKQLGALGAG